MRNCSRDASSSKRPLRRHCLFWVLPCLAQLYSLHARKMSHLLVEEAPVDVVIHVPAVVMIPVLVTANLIVHGVAVMIVEVILDLTNPIRKRKRASGFSLKLSCN